MIKNKLKDFLSKKILGGPFRGMAFRRNSSGSKFFPKILGTYEMEISYDLKEIFVNSRKLIVDIGAAEGYYAIAALVHNPNITVISFEADLEAREICYQIALDNFVENRLDIRGYCNLNELHKILEENTPDLILMDVEGFEETLLDNSQIPALNNQRIFVEIHDCWVKGLGEKIIKRFEKSHTITKIPARNPSSSDIENTFFRVITRISHKLFLLIVHERPSNNYWLDLRPMSSKEKN